MDHKIDLRETGQQAVDFLDLVTHISVGVCKFLLDDNYTLIYGNQAIYDLLGYTQEQFSKEMNNEVIRTFPEEEIDIVKERLSENTQSGLTGFRIEHRIIRRNGEAIWVLVSGSFVMYEGVPAAHGVVVDVTEQKQMQEQLRINEERFRIALAQTDSTIFDYNITTKVMIHADKSAERFGLSFKTQNVPESLVEAKIVHPNTAEKFLDMYRRICEGEPTASCIILTRTTEQCYIWQKITMTNIYDQNGVAVRAVGILEDIDNQMRREERLIEQSQRDTLTGLYNKGNTESQIRKLLSEENPSGAIFIIDLDFFKEVNDQHGHLFGDLVLTESARRLMRLFQKEDIIGRIGGDEFLIYLVGMYEHDEVLQRANQICSSFLEPFSNDGISITVTCTVGTVLCPNDGILFEALYKKADIALYEAKRKGKNQACLYDKFMCGNDE